MKGAEPSGPQSLADLQKGRTVPHESGSSPSVPPAWLSKEVYDPASEAPSQESAPQDPELEPHQAEPSPAQVEPAEPPQEPQPSSEP